MLISDQKLQELAGAIETPADLAEFATAVDKLETAGALQTPVRKTPAFWKTELFWRYVAVFVAAVVAILLLLGSQVGGVLSNYAKTLNDTVGLYEKQRTVAAERLASSVERRKKLRADVARISGEKSEAEKAIAELTLKEEELIAKNKSLQAENSDFVSRNDELKRENRELLAIGTSFSTRDGFFVEDIYLKSKKLYNWPGSTSSTSRLEIILTPKQYAWVIIYYREGSTDIFRRAGGIWDVNGSRIIIKFPIGMNGEQTHAQTIMFSYDDFLRFARESREHPNQLAELVTAGPPDVRFTNCPDPKVCR